MASNREGPAGQGSSYCFYPAKQSRCTVLSSNSQTLQNSRCRRVWTEERVLRRKGIKRWKGTGQSGCSWRAAPGWVLLWKKTFFFFAKKIIYSYLHKRKKKLFIFIMSPFLFMPMKFRTICFRHWAGASARLTPLALRKGLINSGRLYLFPQHQ